MYDFYHSQHGKRIFYQQLIVCKFTGTHVIRAILIAFFEKKDENTLWGKCPDKEKTERKQFKRIIKEQFCFNG